MHGQQSLLQMQETWTLHQQMPKSLHTKTEQQYPRNCQNWRSTWRRNVYHSRQTLRLGFLKWNPSQAQGDSKNCTINCVILGCQQYKQLWVPSYKMNTRNGQDVSTRIFIDCRANINCIGHDFAKKHKVNLRKLEKPLPINNMDRTPNKKGWITHIASFFIKIGGIIHKETFHMMKCGKDNLILGLPWLNQISPQIDWKNKHINIHDSTNQTDKYNIAISRQSFVRQTIKETPTHLDLLPTDYEKEPPIFPDENFVDYVWGTTTGHIYADRINRYKLIKGKLVPIVIAKTSIASKIAQKTEEKNVPLLERYKDFAHMFSEEASQKMPPSHPYDHPIVLDDSFIPKIEKIYLLSPDKQKATDDFIEENLKTRKIRPSTSPQASPFFYIGKKDAGLQPCQDYRYINEHTIKDVYPLPLISDLINKVKDAQLFTKFDIWSRYNNIRIKEGDQWKAAFITSKVLFEPTIMFFGLSNSPATFQRFMNNSFRDMIAEGWLIIYMDNMLLTSTNKEEDTEWTRRVLKRMEELNLHLKLKNSWFSVKEVDFLGLILWPEEIAMDPAKLSGINDWPTPQKVKDVRSFLGFSNYYWRFIGNYSNIAHPLINLTKKDKTWNWSPSCQMAFDQLKKEFSKQPILSLPDLTFCRHNRCITGCIGRNPPPSRLKWRLASMLLPLPNILPSRKILQYIRQRTASRDQKPQNLETGFPFPVKVFTDHKNLLYFKEPQKLNRRQARWMLDISDYDLKLVHIPGKELTGPDALSRRPDLIPKDTNNNDQVTLLPDSLFINIIDSAVANKIAKSSEKVLQALNEDLPSQFWSRLSDWSYKAGILSYQGQIYIPEKDNLRKELIKRFHDRPTAGHPRYLKTKQLLSAGHWWPGMAQFIKKYVEGCVTCQQNKTNTHPTLPPLNPIHLKVTLPFKQISYDLITDLPTSNGFDSLLVVVDHGLTKGVILCPTKKSITAEGVATIIFKKLYAWFWLFNKIISDRGPQFAAKFQNSLPPSDRWGNRKSQPRNRNLPQNLLWKLPIQMGRSYPYGRIHSQHPTPLFHRKVTIPPYHGIQTTGPTRHHQLNQLTGCRKKTRWSQKG